MATTANPPHSAAARVAATQGGELASGRPSGELRRTRLQRAVHDWLPVAVVLVVVLLAWYGATWALNAPGAIERVLDADAGYTWQELFSATMQMERPLMPAPHQVAMDLYESLTAWPLDSPRNLLFHVAVTGESTLLGFVMGTALGLVLSVLIVHSRTLDKALLP